MTHTTQGLYPKSPPIPSFTIPYISPLIQFTWRSEWKRVSEFVHWVHRKDCRFCIVCLLFNNHLKWAAPVVRLKDLSWTLSRKLCINSNSQFTINLYLCCITPWTSSSKINEWMIQLRAPSSGETREFIWRATLTVHYGDSVAVECTSVVHSFLRCIVGLNECTREHPLWFRTPLKMAVPSNSALFEGIGGDFGYSQGWHIDRERSMLGIFFPPGFLVLADISVCSLAASPLSLSLYSL